MLLYISLVKCITRVFSNGTSETASTVTGPIPDRGARKKFTVGRFQRSYFSTDYVLKSGLGGV